MYWKPTTVEEAISKTSGKLRVVKGLGLMHLSTDKIQQSGGIVSEIWRKVLVGEEKNKRWLVLGVAGGSVIKLISEKYKPMEIVGIDIDPVIVNLGNKYFDLDKVQNLNIKIVDAEKFVVLSNDKFDYVIVDLFNESGCPKFVYKKNFLDKLLKMGEKVWINHLVDNKLKQLEKILIKIGVVNKIRVMKNVVMEVSGHEH